VPQNGHPFLLLSPAKDQLLPTVGWSTTFVSSVLLELKPLFVTTKAPTLPDPDPAYDFVLFFGDMTAVSPK
jgi:hypothetical protein